MRTRTKPYLAALPAVPYLFGVALQVSGVTNIALSVAIFEVAAILGAGVIWALWSDWRSAAVFVPDNGKRITRLRRWDGVKLSKLGCLRPELIIAAIVLLACNALIYGFVGLAEKPHAQPVIAAKNGARLFAKVGAFTKEKKTAEVSVVNDGDVIARMGTRVGTAQQLYDHILNEREEYTLYQLALQNLPPIGTGIEIPVKGGRSIDVESNLTDAQFDSILNGTAHYYVITVISFTDEMTPNGETNLAAVCNRFNKRIDVGLVCLEHNESRMRRTTRADQK